MTMLSPRTIDLRTVSQANKISNVPVMVPNIFLRLTILGSIMMILVMVFFSVRYLPHVTRLVTASRMLTSELGLPATALWRVAGFDRPKHYLILLQNARELRATGGFIGTLAVVTVANGRIKNWNVPLSGSYGLQWRTPDAQPPKPLQMVNDRFEIQDANWWPDFPTSARGIVEMWHTAGGEPIDGVIAVTSTMMKKILHIIGSIPILEYNGVHVSEKNFEYLAEEASARDAASIGAPRRFLATLAPLILSRSEALLKKYPTMFVALALDGFEQKNIQMYSFDPVVTSLIDNLGASGRFPAFNVDGVGVIFSNIGGGKSDGALATNVAIDTELSSLGTRHLITITRTHAGGDQHAAVVNRSYLRVYLPRAARIDDADGFVDPVTGAPAVPEWSTEGSFTVVAGWVRTAPHDVSHIRIRTGQSLHQSASPYEFRFLRQAGLAALTYVHTLHTASRMHIKYVAPRALPIDTHTPGLIQIQSANPPDLTYQIERDEPPHDAI